MNKNTDLKGAIITSTQTAENLKKNSLDTGTLTSSNIQNVTEYDAKGISVGGGFNAGKVVRQVTKNLARYFRHQTKLINMLQQQ